MITIQSWRWIIVGRFRVLAMPLATNPHFTTHRIFLGTKFIVAQLSLPSEQQCEDRLSEMRRQDEEPELPMWPGYSATHRVRRRISWSIKAEAREALEERSIA